MDGSEMKIGETRITNHDLRFTPLANAGGEYMAKAGSKPASPDSIQAKTLANYCRPQFFVNRES
jgi:hypothetical protein